MGDMDLAEVALRVRPAGRFDDGSIFVELLEVSVGICLNSALVELQMLLRIVAVAVGRVGETHCWRSLAARRPIVANIGS